MRVPGRLRIPNSFAEAQNIICVAGARTLGLEGYKALEQAHLPLYAGSCNRSEKVRGRHEHEAANGGVQYRAPVGRFSIDRPVGFPSIVKAVKWNLDQKVQRSRRSRRGFTTFGPCGGEHQRLSCAVPVNEATAGIVTREPEVEKQPVARVASDLVDATGSYLAGRSFSTRETAVCWAYT